MTQPKLTNKDGFFSTELSSFVADEAILDLESLRELAQFLPNRPKQEQEFHATVDECILKLAKARDKGERVRIIKFRRVMRGLIGNLKGSFEKGYFKELLWSVDTLFLDTKILGKAAELQYERYAKARPLFDADL